MMGFTFILALVFGNQVIYGAKVLEGYMVAKDGSVCIKTDEVSGVVDTSSVCCPVDADELAGLSCTLIAIYDGTTDGRYIIEDAADFSKQLKLNVGAAITFPDTGTEVTFTPEGTMTPLTGITSADVISLTTMSESVYVADVADDVDNTDCLLLTGTYVQGDSTGDCTDQLWYFVTVPCTDSNCKLCNTGPDLCSVCEVGSAFNEARTECVVRAAAAATTTEGGREEGFDIDASEEERSGVLLGKASLMVVIGLASFLLILF